MGSPESIQLSGRVLDTRMGELLVSYEVPGPADSLPRLVDRFAVGLLAGLTGVDAERIRSLDGTALRTLEAYLEGHRELRAGRFEAARDRFGLAQRVDSTFALPGMFHVIAASFTSRWDRSGGELAWRHRESLSPRDQVLLQAVLGEGIDGWSERKVLLERTGSGTIPTSLRSSRSG